MDKGYKYAAIHVSADVSTKRRSLVAALRLQKAPCQFFSNRKKGGISLNGDVVMFYRSALLKDATTMLLDIEEKSIKFSN